MGFLDKLKDTFQQITGGAGSMTISLGNMQVRRGENLSFTATLASTGNLKGKAVHARIVAVEHVKYEIDVPDTTPAPSPATASNALAKAAGNTQATTPAPVTTHKEERSTDNQTYENKQVLAQEEIALDEGESKQFSGTFNIPATAQPTYTGVDATHTWKLVVYLDVPMGADISAEAEFAVL